MAARYWVGGNDNWDGTAGSKWATSSGGAGGAAAPTAADDVFLDNGTGTGNVTITTNVVCRSLNCTGYVKTLTHNTSVTVSIGDGTAGASNVALKLVSGMTYTRNGGSSSIFKFVSTSTTQQTIDCAGKTMGSLQWDGVNGTWVLAGDVGGTTGNHVLTNGSLDFGGRTVTANYFQSSNSNTRSLTLGAADITLSGAFNGVWSLASTTGLTFSGASSTITCPGGGAEIFRGGGQAYGTVNLTGSGNVTVTGANTFVNFTRSNAVACTLTLPANTTQTITGALQLSGTSGNVLTLQSSSAGTAATISKGSGVVACDYMSVKDSTATGGASWYAGRNSTDVSGNSGWSFVAYSSAGAALAGSGTLASAGNVGATVVIGDAALSGSGALDAAGTRTTLAGAAPSGTGTLNTTGTRITLGAAALSGAGTLTGAGIWTTLGEAVLGGSGLLATAGVRQTLATASLSGAGVLGADGYATVTAGAGLLGTGVLAAAYRERTWHYDNADGWTYDHDGTATIARDEDWSYA